MIQLEQRENLRWYTTRGASLRDKLWDLLLISTEDHETTILGPRWVTVGVLVAANEDSSDMRS